MAAASRVYFPSGFQELFSIWNRLHDAVLYAGGTGNIRYNEAARTGRQIISLDKLIELKNISRTERYIEIGAMVTLNQIIRLGKIVPEALSRCLEQIEGPQLRNLATIGGNICNPYQRLDITGPMIALDAQYELRSEKSLRWIPAARFSPAYSDGFDGNELLTRVRIPLEQWTFTWYRKFKTPKGDRFAGNIVLLIKNHRDILTGIRVLYRGEAVLRNSNSETLLEGKRLPLDRKDAAAFVDSWRNYLANLDRIGSRSEAPGGEASPGPNTIFQAETINLTPEMIKTQIINFMEATISRISE